MRCFFFPFAQSSTVLLFVSSLILLHHHQDASVVLASEDCYPGEEQLTFEIFLDEDSLAEQGWTLACDGEENGFLWNIQPGDLVEKLGVDASQHTDTTEMMVRDETCLPESFTCNFTVIDAFGDGLIGNGYYTLTYGPTTVAVYEHETFETATYCFGPNCPTSPIEIATDTNIVYMHLRLDAAPNETSYAVECNESTLWEGTGFSNVTDIVEEAEVPTDSCCRFTIQDSGNDGLTKQDDANVTGSIYLEYAYGEVLSYDGASGCQFSTLMIDFGSGC